jgi:hypothetical protein
MSGNGEFRVVRASDVEAPEGGEKAWLIESLWSALAVGVIGGAPKCCKSWLALEMAVAVASGKPCLGRFRVPDPGPALVLSAEEPPQRVRERLLHLAQARGADFATLDVHLILDLSVRLDRAEDQDRLRRTLSRHRPRLLVLDPWVRLQRAHENDAGEVSAILAEFRELSREFALSLVLVHHARKEWTEDLGQALRGSSDFHAWGDSNLYLRRRQETLMLSAEHRSAAAPPSVALRLVVGAGPLRLEVRDLPAPTPLPSLEDRVLGILSDGRTVRLEALRRLLQVRKQGLVGALRTLTETGRVRRTGGGWTSLPPPASVPEPGSL